MTITILIGKNRRITLDELSSLSQGGAKLEMQVLADADDKSNDEISAAADDDALMSALVQKLSLNESELLSPEATIASLALLSLTLAQGRVVRGECAIQLSSKLVDLVNSILRSREQGTDDSTLVRLPANGEGFASSVNSLVGETLGIVEDRPYLARLISLGRVALALTQGTCDL